MAKRKKRNNLTCKKGWWYYRLCWGTGGVDHKEKTIPLKTKDKSVANRLGKKVDAIADDVRNGIYQDHQIKDLLPWLNSKGTSEIKEHTLESVTPQYLDYKNATKRKSTANRDRIAINQLCDFIGYSKPIAEIDYLHIEGKSGLINHLRSKGYADSGINITLRHLRTFFNWLYNKAKLIDEPIKFDMIDEGEQLYCYFNEYEINSIYNYIDDDSNGVDSFYKRCLYFYEHTGVRAIEPFIGELIGDWLIIDASKSKGKNVRKIQLSEELKAILMEMQSFRDEYVAGGSPEPNVRAYTRISRTLLKITRALELTGKKLTIKSFRHTYGIRRVYLTGNIFQVAMEMGHKNVTTTQHYLRFQMDMIKSDFPSLAVIIDNMANIEINMQDGNKKMGTQYSNVNKLYGSHRE